MTGIARLSWTAIDCDEPTALAAFYSALTGWPIDDGESDSDWVQLLNDDAVTLAFQRVDGYRAPIWPGQDHPQQEHCDFEVSDLDIAEQAVIAIGARRHELQPGHTFRVFLDPAGHPFCLILR
jgi:hypothetical protein